MDLDKRFFLWNIIVFIIYVYESNAGFFSFYTILLFRQVHQEEEFAGGNLSVSRSGSQSLLLN